MGYCLTDKGRIQLLRGFGRGATAILSSKDRETLSSGDMHPTILLAPEEGRAVANPWF